MPKLHGIQAMIEAGHVTGASGRNWDSYGQGIALPAGFGDDARALLTDPQTSGGLLVACSPDALERVMACFAHHGFGDATVIGKVGDASATPRVVVA